MEMPKIHNWNESPHNFENNDTSTATIVGHSNPSGHDYAVHDRPIVTLPPCVGPIACGNNGSSSDAKGRSQ